MTEASKLASAKYKKEGAKFIFRPFFFNYD